MGAPLFCETNSGPGSTRGCRGEQHERAAGGEASSPLLDSRGSETVFGGLVERGSGSVLRDSPAYAGRLGLGEFARLEFSASWGTRRHRGMSGGSVLGIRPLTLGGSVTVFGELGEGGGGSVLRDSPAYAGRLGLGDSHAWSLRRGGEGGSGSVWGNSPAYAGRLSNGFRRAGRGRRRLGLGEFACGRQGDHGRVRKILGLGLQ